MRGSSSEILREERIRACMSESDAFILKKLKDRVPSIAYMLWSTVVMTRHIFENLFEIGLEMLNDDAYVFLFNTKNVPLTFFNFFITVIMCTVLH